MQIADLFGIGGAWTNALRGSAAQQPVSSPDAPLATAVVRLNTAESDAAAAAALRDTLNGAVTSLRDALGRYARSTSPQYAVTGAGTQEVPAWISGSAAPVDAAGGRFPTLAATQAVNSGASTVHASSAPVGLDVTSAESASALASSAEMNTGYVTSYGSSSLTFRKGGQTSTSTATLTGTYTGTGAAANATSLTVISRTAATLAPLVPTAIQFDVTDQDGTVLFSYDGSLAADETVYLGDDIGLSISFAAGQLRNQHTATTTVTKTPIEVNTAAAFNAGAGAPAFDGGAHVTAGSFTVNGTSIAVNADDTIDAVLTRINSSGAGVTATVAGDRVRLLSATNSEDPILLGADSSGFLAATKLSGAATTLGNVRDDLQVLAKTSQFGDVTTGSFNVNGVAIAVDKDADSLATVLARVNTSGAGVTAAYDAATDTVTFTPDTAGSTLTIDGDTSGLLSALHVSTGVFSAHANADGAFNATGASGPLFDAGLSVQAGSFTVNGVSIAVDADDTIATVLARVTASAAGVTAEYDAATDLVRLVANSEDAGPIVVGNDTSGFLAAVKLDATAVYTTNPAMIASLATAIGDVAGYAGVTAGTITINGAEIAIDPGVTTVFDVVNAINDLSGVSAIVSTQTGEIAIWSDAAKRLTLRDTSGLLAALGIDVGRHGGTADEALTTTVQTGVTTTSNVTTVVSDVADAVDRLNSALADVGGGDAVADVLRSLVEQLQRENIRGLGVTTSGGQATLAVDRDALADAFGALADDADLSRQVGAILDGLTEAIGSAAGWGAEAPVTQAVPLESTVRAQFTAEQTAAALMFARATLQPQQSTEAAFEAALRAYLDAQR